MISFNQVKEGLLENRPMVTLNALEKKFGNQHILRNITHTFKTGSKTVVLGSNGSGKSTLIKIISGAVEASNNPPEYNFNKPVAANEAGKLSSMAAPYMALNPMFTLTETLSFHEKMCGFAKTALISEWVEKAGLSKHQSKRIQTYSSGMLQRVRLLMAIASDRSLLLLDEPTSNLDADGVQFYKHLIEHFTLDKTVIVASNYVEREYAFCESELILEKHY